MTTKLERTSYTYNDKCSKKRLEIIQNRLKSENKTSDEKVKEMVGVYFRDNDLSGDVIGIDDYSGVMVAENFITNVNKSEEQLDEENIVVVQMEISNIKNNRVSNY